MPNSDVPIGKNIFSNWIFIFSQLERFRGIFSSSYPLLLWHSPILKNDKSTKEILNLKRLKAGQGASSYTRQPRRPFPAGLPCMGKRWSFARTSFPFVVQGGENRRAVTHLLACQFLVLLPPCTYVLLQPIILLLVLELSLHEKFHPGH